MKAFQVFLMLGLMVSGASAQVVYKCERANGVVEYANGSNVPSGCKRVDIESAPVMTVPAPKGASGKAGSSAAATSPANFPKVDPAVQKSRDNDRRKVLEGELKVQEDKLAALRTEYRNGEPERRGDERNYQKYLDRVESLKQDIDRTESNIASVKRELAQLRE